MRQNLLNPSFNIFEDFHIFLHYHCIYNFTTFAFIMKFLATILALIILSLSALPCDDNSFNDQQTETVSQVLNLDNHSHSDLCSPFCMCSCCSVSITEPIKHVEYLVYAEKPSKVVPAFYTSSFSNNYYSKIYLPPQA
jgi:ferredoxin